MTADWKQQARRWKRITIAVGVVALASILAVVVMVPRLFRPRLTDERLLGTWQSDAERTMAGLLDGKPGEEEREAKFRRIFGRMRITYTGESLTSVFNGNVETSRYEVLGKDASSVVIHTLDDKPSPLDGIFEVSKFHVIHFEGPDSYWLDSELGQIREYFRRLP